MSMDAGIPGQAEVGMRPDWRPTPQLRQWLWAGVAGVALSIVLTGGSLWIAARQGIGDSLGPGEWLDMLGGLPLVLTLVAMLKLARQIDSVGLWRSSLAVFGCMWLILAMMPLQSEERPALWEALVVLVIIAGMVGLAYALIHRPWHRVVVVDEQEMQAADAQTPADGPIPLEYGKKESEGGKWILPFAIGLIVFRRILQKMDGAWAITVAALVVVLVLGLAASTVAWGIAKIRLRSALGPWATASGVADLAVVAVGIGCLAATIVMAVRAGEEGLPDTALVPMLVGQGASILWQAMLAAMLISAARR